MAAPSKRRFHGVSEDDDCDTASEVLQENEHINEEIEVDFEVRAPSDGDREGIQSLLQQLLLKANINTKSLTDIILQQKNVGSVIKQSEVLDEDSDDDDDDDFVLGITTIINITERNDVDCIKELKSHVTKKVQKSKPQQLQYISSLFDRDKNSLQHIGWILNERFINIPPQVAPPLYESLFKEIAAARSNQPTFTFDYYILICKIYKSTKKTKKVDIEFSNPEEEIFSQEAEESFEYCVAGESDLGLSGDWNVTDKTLKPYRRLLVIPAEKIDSIILTIKEKYLHGLKITK